MKNENFVMLPDGKQMPKSEIIQMILAYKRRLATVDGVNMTKEAIAIKFDVEDINLIMSYHPDEIIVFFSIYNDHGQDINTVSLMPRLDGQFIPNAAGEYVALERWDGVILPKAQYITQEILENIFE